MWTDWQFTSPTDAKGNLAALVTARAGQIVSLNINGKKNDFQPKTDAELSRLIQDLQKYIFECEQNGWDWASSFDPGLQRPGITRGAFCR